jgi:hypothetical protein
VSRPEKGVHGVAIRTWLSRSDKGPKVLVELHSVINQGVGAIIVLPGLVRKEAFDLQPIQACESAFGSGGAEEYLFGIRDTLENESLTPKEGDASGKLDAADIADSNGHDAPDRMEAGRQRITTGY